MPPSQVLIFLLRELGREKNNLIQLKPIPAAGIGPVLAAIKVNAGTTLIKVSPLLLPSQHLRALFNGLVTRPAWQPLHLLYP